MPDALYSFFCCAVCEPYAVGLPPSTPNLAAIVISLNLIDCGRRAWSARYTVEYAVALLMNLCLRSSGKKRCVGRATKILRALCNFLGHENHEVRTYIHGTLYSLLAVPEIRAAAQVTIHSPPPLPSTQSVMGRERTMLWPQLGCARMPVGVGAAMLAEQTTDGLKPPFGVCCGALGHGHRGRHQRPD